MDVREKLVELANDVLRYLPWGEIQKDTAERIVDRMMDHGVTVQEWISVKDRLPKPNKLVLCWWQSGDGEKEHYGFATFQSHGVWYVSNEGMSEVTHWMPLPEPPKEENR